MNEFINYFIFKTQSFPDKETQHTETFWRPQNKHAQKGYIMCFRGILYWHFETSDCHLTFLGHKKFEYRCFSTTYVTTAPSSLDLLQHLILSLTKAPPPFSRTGLWPLNSSGPSPSGHGDISSSSGSVLVQDGTWQREKDTGNFIILQ